MEPGERIAAITHVTDFRGGQFLVTLTKKGQIKKTAVSEYQNVREKGIIGVKIEDDDELLSATVTDGQSEFVIATRRGQSIRFPEEQVRPMGRSSKGVRAIGLDDDDHVVGMVATMDGCGQLLAVCENGFGKRTDLQEFRVQHRGGKGVRLIETSERNGPVVGIALVSDADQLMMVTDRGQMIRTKIAEIRETGRVAQGVRIMTLGEGERVVALERIAEREDEDESEGNGEVGETKPAGNGKGRGANGHGRGSKNGTKPAPESPKPPQQTDLASGLLQVSEDESTDSPQEESE